MRVAATCPPGPGHGVWVVGLSYLFGRNLFNILVTGYVEIFHESLPNIMEVLVLLLPLNAVRYSALFCAILMAL